MDATKKKKDQLFKRHLRKRQKEYMRLERQTVRKQQKELRRLKNRYRYRNLQRYFAKLFFTFKKRSGPGLQRKTSIKARNEGNKPIRKLKNFRQDKKRTVRERKKAKAELNMLRRKIRSARYRQWKTNLRTFLGNPFKRKPARSGDKILKRQIRQDIKEERRRRFRELPFRMIKAFQRFFRNRKRVFRYRKKKTVDLLSPVTGRVNSERLLPELVISLINSTVLFILAFWIVFYSLHLASLLAAKYYSIPAVLTSFKVDWPLYTYSVRYSRRVLVMIFGIGPLMLFLASILLYRWNKKLVGKSGFGALFITWILFHSISQVFGGLIAGLMTRTGLARTIEWLFLTQPFDNVEVVLLAAAVFILFFAGFKGTRLFLKSAQNPAFLKPRIRPFYVVFVILLPWFIGSGLLYLSNIPDNPPELILLLGVSFLVILPMISNYNKGSLQSVRLSHNGSSTRVLWVAVVLIPVGFLLIRTLIYPGISIN